MFDAADDAERTWWIDRIMEADDDFLSRHPESTLFAYFAGQPTKSVLQQADSLREWEEAEDRRERLAQESGGEYYPRGPFATALGGLDEQRALNDWLRGRIAQLQSELEAMQARYLYTCARRVVDSKWVRAMRGNSAVAGLERRVRG